MYVKIFIAWALPQNYVSAYFIRFSNSSLFPTDLPSELFFFWSLKTHIYPNPTGEAKLSWEKKYVRLY